MTNDNKFSERRKHARLPIIHDMVEPVDLTYQDPREKGKMQTQPAILANLSAGGMRLVTFMEPPKTGVLEMCIELPGLGKIPVKGRISWIHSKGDVFTSGIAFTEISKVNCDKINAIAEDYEDCETRIGLKLPEVCVPNCKSYYLCNKMQKDSELFEPSKRTAKKTSGK